jgi:hypothetical protein
MPGMCPKCGHSILNHRKGQCLVIVTVTPGREPVKGHCGCTHIKAPDAIQLFFRMELD